MDQDQKTFIKSLSDWFIEFHRKLPWRDEPTLYKTVVSEFMLQQTQVDTALPYFDKWLKTFPDFKALAQASEEKVVKHWEGLGYYRRARNLHKLSKEIVELPEYPKTPEEWCNFSGIGPYSSAAITSIALGYPVAVVDGNLIRILSRIFADDTSFKDNTQAMKHFTPMAEALLDRDNPGRHNEAMMELGATICFKQKPLCTVCPVVSLCQAAKQGNPEQFPQLQRKKIEKVSKERAYLIHDGAILLHKAPASSKRLAHLYEFPLISDVGARKLKSNFIFTKTRGISNQRIEEHFYNIKHSAKVGEKVKESESLHWIPLKQIEHITLSGPHRKWYEILSKQVF